MTQQEADNLIVYLRELMDDMEPILEVLTHAGLDTVHRDIMDVVVSLHAAIMRLEKVFPFETDTVGDR